MNIENIIARIDNAYDPEGVFLGSTSFVTKTDHDLVLCISELQERIEKLQKQIDELKADAKRKISLVERIK